MTISPFAFALVLTVGLRVPDVAADTLTEAVVLDDFESDRPGELPQRWRYYSRRKREFVPLKPLMRARQCVVVLEEKGNNFVRLYTEGEALRISLPADEMSWNLSDYSTISWDWRALHLPTGAREDRVNDSGGAVYVSFSETDWLGRPLSIKYVYSSALPVGEQVSTGNVKIIVASSGTDGTGRWITVTRNVADDYRWVFGEDPPLEPFTVTLWSDSDNTRSVGEVDFDNLVLTNG